jgi:hypothetical protein
VFECVCVCVREMSGTRSPNHQTAHTDTCKTYHTVYITLSLRRNPRVSKHVGDNRNLENFAFRWFLLYNYITIHGRETLKKTVMSNEIGILRLA